MSELFRKRKGVLRSLHPTHSVAVSGPHAADFVRDHHECGACAQGSPFDHIARAGGHVMLIGCSHTANTTIHIGEMYAGVPRFAAWEGDAPVIDIALPDGSHGQCSLDTSAGCSFAFNALDFYLRKNRLIRDFQVGNALSTIMKGQDVIDATVRLLQDDPTVMLCTREECTRCNKSRAHWVASG